MTTASSHSQSTFALGSQRGSTIGSPGCCNALGVFMKSTGYCGMGAPVSTACLR